MARIANVRSFNGTSDEIQLVSTDWWNAGGTVTIGPFTVVAIVRRTTAGTGFGWIWSVQGDSTNEVAFGTLRPSDLAGWTQPQTISTPSNAPFAAADGWCLIAMTKAASGTSTVRMHRYRYSDGNWYHADIASGTDQTPITSSSLWLGTYNGTSEWYEGQIAVVGAWKSTALTDAQIENLRWSIGAWEAMSPTGLWLLNQPSASLTLTDRVGAGDQIGINGTTVTAVTDLPFDVEGAGGYQRLHGPSQLTTAATDLYTVPTGSRTRLRHIYVNNPSSAEVELTASVGTDAAATRLYDRFEIPAAGSLEWAYDHALVAGEKVQAWSGAGSLLLNGTADYIDVGGGDIVGTGALTIAFITKASSSLGANDQLYGQDGANFAVLGMQGTVISYFADTGAAGAVVGPTLNHNEWVLIAYTKATGTNLGRWHYYRYSTSTWSHAAGTGTANGSPGNPTTVHIGRENANSLFWAGHILIGGVWDSELSDASVEALAIGPAAWGSAAETWRLDGRSSITSLKGTSTESARVGTTLSGDMPAGWGDLPFPSTPILDDFTGSDETPITTNWTTPLVSGDNAARRINNEFTPNASGVWSGAWYDTSVFAADCEAYFTITALPADDTAMNVWARITSPGTATPDGYMVQYVHDIDNPPSGMTILRVDNGSGTNLGSISLTALSVGDKVGIRCVGSSIQSWKCVSGVWSMVASVTDTTYTAAGYLGVEVNGTLPRLDNFGGGSLSPYSTVVLADSPTVYYRMNESSGQPQDSSGNARHTTAVNGTPDYSRDGPFPADTRDAGINFVTASTERFTTPDETALDLGDTFSIEAWIKRTEFGTGEYQIVSKGRTGTNYGYALILHNNLIKGGAAGLGFWAQSTVTIPFDGRWYHVACTKTGATRAIYVNGVDVTDTSPGNKTCLDNTQSLAIGAEILDGTPGSHFTGILSEIAVYSTVLSAARVLAHYQEGLKGLPVITIDGYVESA